MTPARKAVRASITSCAIPSRLATYFAMPTLQQPLSCQRFETATDSSSGSQTRSAAATELSTPPLIPRITVGCVMVGAFSVRQALDICEARVRGELMHVLKLCRDVGFLHQLGGTHVTDPLKVGAFFHRKGRRVDFADENAGFEELHLLDGGDGAVDLSA